MSGHDHLDELLATAPIPDSDAAEARARAVILGAYATRQPAPARRPRSIVRLGLGVAVAALIASAAVASTTHLTVSRLVHATHLTHASHTAAAPARLPDGSLLVRTRSGVELVHADGRVRALGPFADASWSPHGRFVVLTGGRHLVVRDPRTGATRWSITTGSAIHGARWSLEPTVPPCCRLAYVTGDSATGTLYTIAGDGTGTRELAPADPAIAPAWRPGSTNRELAFVTPGGGVRRVQAETGAALAPTVHPASRPIRLAWSADGSRLLVLGTHGLAVYDASTGAVVRRLVARPGDGFASGSFLAHGRALVLLERLRGRSRVTLIPARGATRTLAIRSGTLSGLAPAPDGRSVLLGLPDEKGWVILSVGTPARTRTLAAVGTAGGGGSHPFDDGWRAAG